MRLEEVYALLIRIIMRKKNKTLIIMDWQFEAINRNKIMCNWRKKAFMNL